jgi:hypothetical protein
MRAWLLQNSSSQSLSQARAFTSQPGKLSFNDKHEGLVLDETFRYIAGGLRLLNLCFATVVPLPSAM